MFKSYIKIAFRNLWKEKGFSAINIIGLAVGLCCSLLIILYVVDELSFDKYNEKASRIYRVGSNIKFGGTTLNIVQTSDMMGESLKRDCPQIEDFTRFYANAGSKLIKKGTEFINEPNVAHVDASFFNVFTMPAIAGNTKTALLEPNTVVLTRSTAIKYFGNENILGRTIETNDNNSTVYKITAVIQDIPKNSHFHFDLIFSMKNVDYEWGQFTSHNFHTYLLFKPGVDASGFSKNFDQYIDKYVMPQISEHMQIKNFDELKQSGNSLSYELMPLTKIHLYSNKSFELSPVGNIKYIYIFCAISFFILLIACVNFMNLTTARSASRAKEVGIRKVLGTQRKMLITQFLAESSLMVFFSLILSLLLAYTFLPLFNDVANKTMSMKVLLSPFYILCLCLLPFVVGLFAGGYPAFYLSSFKPIAVLKGTMPGSAKGTSLRSLLVVFQFTSSIILIIGTIVIFKQLRYIQNKELGYVKEQVLIINDAYALDKNIVPFKNDLLQMPGVVSGTLSSYLPVASSSRSDDSYSSEAVMNPKNSFSMQRWRIDYDYFKTMGMQLVKGRNFSKEFASDSTAVIITQATADMLPFKDPIGSIIYQGSNEPNDLKSYKIIGVVKSFNYESLKNPIQPLAFFLARSYGLAAFKVKTANLPALLSQIEAKWKTMAPSMPYSYRFLDDSFNDMYNDERRIGKLSLAFSIIAILIACLGLFGLAAFVAEQRTKEIGIRKVLGASVKGLVGLLSKDFIRLVLISFVIATPVAWYFMHKWLQDFEYRITIDWPVFLIAGLIALFIAMATISFQALKAALANPIKNLRSE